MFWFLKDWEVDMRKLGSTTLLKISFIPLQSLPNFAWTWTEDFSSWKRQFSSKHRAMSSRGREMSLKDLNFPLLWIRSSPRWATDGVALSLVAMLHVQNPLDGERCFFSRHFFVKWAKALPGYPRESGFVLVDFPPGHPCQGNFEWTAYLHCNFQGVIITPLVGLI